MLVSREHLKMETKPSFQKILFSSFPNIRVRKPSLLNVMCHHQNPYNLLNRTCIIGLFWNLKINYQIYKSVPLHYVIISWSRWIQYTVYSIQSRTVKYSHVQSCTLRQYDTSQHYLAIYASVSELDSFFQIFHPEFCSHFSFPKYAACPHHIILLGLLMLTIPGDENRLWSS
jgi:hypothetical protein